MSEIYTSTIERINKRHPEIYIDVLETIAQQSFRHAIDLTEAVGYNLTYTKAAVLMLHRWGLVCAHFRDRRPPWWVTERGRIALALHVAKRNIKNARATRAKLLNRADCTRGHNAA